MTATIPPLDDDAWLQQQLAEALERQEHGVAPDLARLARDRPHLQSELAAAFGLCDLLAAGGSAPAVDDTSGQRIAERYRLVARLGHGAAGVVYRAKDEHLQRDVAIKLLHHGLLGGDAATERFGREARILAQQVHANTVRIYDHGTNADGRQFLVTELLEGQSLQAILVAAKDTMPAGPTPASFQRAEWLRRLLPDAALETSYLRQVVRWVAQLGLGLEAAHQAGVYHRDVKPSNAFVRSDGSAMLLDFGIAVQAGDPALTLEHSIVGTPCYMAPEQANGRVEPGPTLDVYGLTATLYHLLTLRSPYRGDVGEVLRALRAEDPVPAARLHRGLPRDLQAILDKGLARWPAQRYQRMQDLVADLQAFLDHRAVSARPLHPVQRTWRRLRRQPVRTLAVLSGLVATAAIAIAVPALAALSTVATTTESKELLAHLPADLAIEGWPDERLLVPLVEQRSILVDLDRLLALEPDNAEVRVLRAALRLDTGQHQAAAADLDHLARQDGSPYLQAVAARYATADATRAGLAAVDLNQLPPPATAADCFVAGFHALRARDSEAADELLGRAATFPPARDLRILAMLGKKRPDAQAIVAEAGRLEGLYGRPTARTRHALGAAMLMLRHWQKAIEYCEEALRLRPDRHGPWNNLGLAHLL